MRLRGHSYKTFRRFCPLRLVRYAMMADHLKSVDGNHIITTGAEGFFKEGSAYASANPNDGNLWALRGGQDFEGNHA